LSLNTEMRVRVEAIRQTAAAVKTFRLVRSDGEPMPVFSGGSHVVVSMNDISELRRNPYSLMSPPDNTSAYEISVLRVMNSRGGSVFMHDTVRVGDELTISQPVNLFPVDHRGRKHILFAGGIGVTPFIAMMEQFTRDNVAFELHYAMRTRAQGAFWQALLERYGPRRVKIYCDGEQSLIPVASIVENQPLGTHLYVCGPSGMIDGVLLTALEAGWPKENLHAERFLAPPTGLPFQVLLEQSGRAITVGEHQSILEAVEAAGCEAPYMCRGGACGQCETAVLSDDGELEHNDIYLSDEEKAEGRKIMICVSRFKGQQLVLQL
jgi:ferredoxin-NADP reductase